MQICKQCAHKTKLNTGNNRIKFKFTAQRNELAITKVNSFTFTNSIWWIITMKLSMHSLSVCLELFCLGYANECFNGKKCVTFVMSVWVIAYCLGVDHSYSNFFHLFPTACSFRNMHFREILSLERCNRNSVTHLNIIITP